ncbi:hypothetical protein [Achromobacter sp. B7]|nr:hypothetical protein [Achromobacter sp. B7]
MNLPDPDKPAAQAPAGAYRLFHVARVKVDGIAACQNLAVAGTGPH